MDLIKYGNYRSENNYYNVPHTNLSIFPIIIHYLRLFAALARNNAQNYYSIKKKKKTVLTVSVTNPFTVDGNLLQTSLLMLSIEIESFSMLAHR